MKKFFFCSILFTITFWTNAQVTTVIDGFSTNLTKNDLPFSGDRKLYAIGLNDSKSVNYIVVSKTAPEL